VGSSIHFKTPILSLRDAMDKLGRNMHERESGFQTTGKQSGVTSPLIDRVYVASVCEASVRRRER
jgi:hypothetical protein